MSLAIVCSHFNPGSFHAPRRNLMRFLRQMQSLGHYVFVAELTYGDVPCFLPAEESWVFCYRGDRRNVLWHKENLINLASTRLPAAFDKIAWIDPDLMFLTPRWHAEAEAALEHFAVIQLFSEAWWTDQRGRCHRQMNGSVADGTVAVGYNHPGFAWAARRELWTVAGGLCELAITGGGDTLFAAACLGDEIPIEMHYPDWQSWLHRQRKWVNNNGGCGYLDGPAVHEWHGADRHRSYIARHHLHAGLDIGRSVAHREDGLLEFTPSVPDSLRVAYCNYFADRAEDGIPASLP